jgi:apolipoprotein N-acyltransferase
MTNNTPKFTSKRRIIIDFVYNNNYDFIIQFIHGALLTLAFHPFDIFLVIPIAFSGFLWCLENQLLVSKTRREFFWKGFSNAFIFFFGHFITSMYWVAAPLFIDIKQYWFLLPFALVVLPVFLSSFYGLISGFICWNFINAKLKNPYQRIVTAFLFSIGFFVAELIRANFLIPFPWNLLGYATNYSLSLMQMAAYTGVYGLSLLLYFVGTIPYTKNPFAISVVTAAVVLITLSGNNRLKQSYSDEKTKNKFVTLYVVQPNLQHHYHQYEKKLAALSKTTSMVNDKSLSAQTPKDSKIKFIILPESAIPFTINKYQNSLFDDLMSKYSINSFLVSGVDRYDNNLQRYYNSMIVINSDGDIIDSYDKTILTPFGEYIPGYGLLRFFLKPIVSASYGFVPGSSTRNIRLYSEDPEVSAEPLIAIPMICFESIFTPLTHPRDNTNADLIINITNDSWLGNSIGPYQHFTMARMRAIEYGVPVVRAAKTGISAVINSYGKVVEEIKLDGEGVIVADMPEDKVNTFYMKVVHAIHGNKF